MPANKKYLTQNPWQRFAKVSAAILGGWMVTTALHLALANWLDRVAVIITSTYSAFLLWAALMVIAFLGKNGWKTWGLYLLATAFFLLVYYLGKTV